MLQFSIGLSALQTAQQALAVAGNNLANASTPGYHRQIAAQGTLNSTTLGSVAIGTGVGITSINRAVSDQLDAAVTQQTSQNGFTDASLNASTLIQQTISSGLTSPATQLEGLLNSIQALSATPSSGSALQSTATSVAAVASSFNTAASDLSQIQTSLDQSISADVGQINSLASQIATLNGQISTLSTQGASPNNLLDQRGQLINNLAQLVGVQVQNGNNGQITVIASGVALVAGTDTETLVTNLHGTGKTTIGVTGSDATVAINGGDLGGLLSQRNQTLANYQNRLDALARQVAISFNAVQSTGVGSTGGFTQLTGKNGTTSPTANLNAAGLSFPPQAGSLFIGVTNTATGQRTLTEVPIDPQSQNIQDVANAIGSTVPNMQAYVNSQTGTLSLASTSGYTFDFAGGFEASPTTNFAGGSTTVPTIGGSYTGKSNDSYTFTFTSSGTVGVTPNLQAQVTNQAGAVVATVDVGQGYQAGQPLTVANGISVTLGNGNIAAGDSFSTPVVGNPDSAGLLNALGINTLFTGNDAASLALNPDIANNPGRLATSTTGQPGDTSNLLRFAALGSASVLNNGTQSFSQYANQMVSDIGTDVQSLSQQQSTNQILTTSITAQQQSVSGVDTNEELAHVMQYQQMFEIAGKYISAVNDALQSLITAVNP